jgi:glycosyltransferase involved in cell wall biosynthesis
VLHERSTKEHFIALETYAEDVGATVHYKEFLIARYFAKSLVKLDPALFVQQIRNVFFFIGLLFSKNKKIVLGVIPLDKRLSLLNLFLKKHNVFFMTSWGDWSGKRFPRHKSSNVVKLEQTWKDFLERDVKGIFCVTQSGLDNLKTYYKVTAPTAVVGHSVDNSIQVQLPTTSDSKTKKIQLIYVGRLVDTKGIYELIALMKTLDATKYTLKILGLGPLKEEVIAASETYPNIQYEGFVKDKKKLFELYAQSDVQLLFSKKSKINFWEELFGMVIIEAMYCGLVTIATNHVGPRSIIEHGTNGFLINEDSMVEETKKLLETNAFQDAQLKLHAQKTAKKFYKKNLSKAWAKVLDPYILPS